MTNMILVASIMMSVSILGLWIWSLEYWLCYQPPTQSRFAFSITEGNISMRTWPDVTSTPWSIDYFRVYPCPNKDMNRHYGFRWPRYSVFKDWWSANVPLWPPLLLSLCVTGFILARYRRRFPAHCCRNCGYSLKGNKSGTCPECGEAVQQPTDAEGTT